MALTVDIKNQTNILVSRFSFLVSRFSFLVSRFSFLVSRFSFLLIVFVTSTTVAEENNGRYFEFGSPGSLKSRTIPGSFPLEIRAHEKSAGPAIEILSRAGVADKKQIPAATIHNYAYGPGLQIDQTGPAAALVLKQSRNGKRMPESGGKVSDAPFLEFNRAAEPGGKEQTITVFDRFGNLRFDKDIRQKERSIRVKGSDLRLGVDIGKVIIAEQPIVVPRVTTAQNGRLFGALGMLDRQLSVWNGEKWLPLQFQRREGRRKRYKRYFLTATFGFGGGLAGALVLLIMVNQFPWLKKFTRLFHPAT